MEERRAGFVYAGIDEAGYGPRLGPLCVGCCVMRFAQAHIVGCDFQQFIFIAATGLGSLQILKEVETPSPKPQTPLGLNRPKAPVPPKNPPAGTQK